MTKLKLFGLTTVLVLGAVVVGSFAFAHADTTLGVTCSGTVSGTNQIVWTATTTGGTAPYSFVWSGNSSIVNSTSSTITGIYATSTTNTTYTADVTVTDASSTVATSLCSQTVAGIVPPATTSTLNVLLSVNNTAGGNAIPSNFTVSVNGASALPSSFIGSASGTSVIVAGNTSYTVGASALANYSASQSGVCTGPIAAGGATSCTVTETYVTPTSIPTPTSTPFTPRVNPPTLNIGGDGSFLSRGMVVTGVGTNSFTAAIWGITYTVNWSGNLSQPFEFFFRRDAANVTSTPATQLKVGDEVGVAGMVSTASSLTVNATVVRDYSIAVPRPPEFEGEGNGQGNNGLGLGNGGPNGENQNAGGNSTQLELTARLNQLLQQFQNLQNMLKNNGNGNGKGQDN